VLLQQGQHKKDIARAIGVHVSTVYRELQRNKGKRGGYGWRQAREMAEERKERLPGNRKIKDSLRNEALKLLKEEQWSPAQISGYLKQKGFKISHETIYALIRSDKQNGGSLYTHCRHRLKHGKRPVGKCTGIPNRVSIHERPKEAGGNRFGDIEMDTVVGKDGAGAILTMTERSTNFIWIQKLEHGKNAAGLAKEVIRLLFPYRKILKSITTDNGSEFAAHEMIAEALDLTVYFADPYASWQKGSIENANKLIRQYIPKGSSFKDMDDDRIRDIQHKINRRPREKLDFVSPKERFFKYL
jgi:IS30 family transposase